MFFGIPSEGNSVLFSKICRIKYPVKGQEGVESIDARIGVSNGAGVGVGSVRPAEQTFADATFSSGVAGLWHGTWQQGGKQEFWVPSAANQHGSVKVLFVHPA